MREDFPGGKDGFRLRKLPNPFNRSPENRKKTLMMLATIVCIILSNAPHIYEMCKRRPYF